MLQWQAVVKVWTGLFHRNIWLIRLIRDILIKGDNPIIPSQLDAGALLSETNIILCLRIFHVAMTYTKINYVSSLHVPLFGNVTYNWLSDMHKLKKQFTLIRMVATCSLLSRILYIPLIMLMWTFITSYSYTFIWFFQSFRDAACNSIEKVINVNIFRHQNWGTIENNKPRPEKACARKGKRLL